MGEACRAFGIPVVGGNVSLYNESRRPRHRPDAGRRPARRGRPARPPPAGRAPGRRRHAARARSRAPDRSPGRGGRGSAGAQAGPAPDLDLDAHARGRRPRRATLVAEGLVAGVHDAADGLGVALAEMAVRSRRGLPWCGARAPTTRWLFAESPSRVVACVHERPARRRRAGRAGGRRRRRAASARSGGDRLVVDGLARRAASPRPPTRGAAASPTRSAPGPRPSARRVDRSGCADRGRPPGRLVAVPAADDLDDPLPRRRPRRRRAASSASTPPASRSPT